MYPNRFRRVEWEVPLLDVLALVSLLTVANPRPSFHETVQVTATRLPEDVLDVPATVAVVTGEELEARGATDLATALALVGGVSVAPGGDGGRLPRSRS